MEAEKNSAVDGGYTGNKFEGSNYRATREMNFSDVVKTMRERFKVELPGVKISTVQENYSMGRALHVSIMSAPQDVFDFSGQTENYRGEMVPAAELYSDVVERKYMQVNQYHVKEHYGLSQYGRDVIAKVNNIVNSFNYDDSDSQIDYFDTRFYLHLNIGKWDKPFIVK